MTKRKAALWTILAVGFSVPAFLSLRRTPTHRPTTLLAQNQATATALWDAAAISQARALTASTMGSTGTPQLTPSQGREYAVAQLLALPVDVLKKAYYKKMDEIEKGPVNQRFPSLETSMDRKHQSETLFNLLQEAFEEGDYWLANTSASVGGKSLTLTLLLSFYDAANITDASRAIDVKDSKNLCWHLATFLGEEASEHWTTSSACIENIRHTSDGYYIVQTLDGDEIEAHYSHLAVPLPLKQSATAFLGLLQAGNQKWVKNGPLHWGSISRLEAERIQKDRIKSRGD